MQSGSIQRSGGGNGRLKYKFIGKLFLSCYRFTPYFLGISRGGSRCLKFIPNDDWTRGRGRVYETKDRRSYFSER